jgi:histidinol-phosphate phosphatase family protein
MEIEKLNIDRSWTLFLDRDGVINKRLVGDYVSKWEDFEFLPGVLDAIRIFTSHFDRIFIVTNQQGIGKGLMSDSDLEFIHKEMLNEIESNKGKIDKIYYCPDLRSKEGNYRKPNPFMGFKAKEDFPEIDLQKSIMCGDMESDMHFGRNCGMYTIMIGGKKLKNKKQIDFNFDSLIDFAKELEKL